VLQKLNQGTLSIAIKTLSDNWLKEKRAQDEIKYTSSLTPQMKNNNLNAQLYGKFRGKLKGGGHIQGGGSGSENDNDNEKEYLTLLNTQNLKTEMFEKWKDTIDDIDVDFFNAKKIGVNYTPTSIGDSDSDIDSLDTISKIGEIKKVTETIKSRHVEKYITTAKRFETVVDDIKSNLNKLLKNHMILKADKDNMDTNIKNIKENITMIRYAKEKMDNIVNQVSNTIRELETFQELISRNISDEKKKKSLRKEFVNTFNTKTKNINELIEELNKYVGNENINETADQPGEKTNSIKNDPIQSVNELRTKLEEILKRGKSSGRNANSDNNKYSEVWETYVKGINDDEKQIDDVRDTFYKSVKVNNLDPGQALKVTSDDRIIFIITIFITAKSLWRLLRN